MRVAVLANLKKNAPTWEGMSADQWDDLDSEKTIESIMAAEIIAINRGSNQLEVDLISEREDSAMYIINAGHGKAVEIERRFEKLFPTFRLQSYRTRGIALQSPFRTYFVERPEYPEPEPAPHACNRVDDQTEQHREQQNDHRLNKSLAYPS